jgi:hypothetical protein
MAHILRNKADWRNIAITLITPPGRFSMSVNRLITTVTFHNYFIPPNIACSLQQM